MIKIAIITNNKKNPVFDLIFSVELSTLQDVTPKLVEPFLL